MTSEPPEQAARIHIIGGSGSGKTTLALRLADRLKVPAFHLDDIARVGGGRGQLRTHTERDAVVTDILQRPAWVCEGIHIGWTEPLLQDADVVIWLDQVSVRLARRRVMVRFVRDALREARQRRGRDRYLRLGDYIRHIGGLRRHLTDIAAYGRPAPDVGEAGEESRARTAAALAAHIAKVIHCTQPQDVEEALGRLTTRADGPA